MTNGPPIDGLSAGFVTVQKSEPKRLKSLGLVQNCASRRAPQNSGVPASPLPLTPARQTLNVSPQAEWRPPECAKGELLGTRKSCAKTHLTR
jgi:hypothetical protein